MQSALPPSDASHQFEAAQMGTEQKRASTGVELCAYQRLALDGDAEAIDCSLIRKSDRGCGGEYRMCRKQSAALWTAAQGESCR